MYAEFDLVIPSNRQQALSVLAEAGDVDSVMPLAGGTNVIVDLRARSISPGMLVELGNLADLEGIEVRNGRVSMGARTTLNDILTHPQMMGYGASLIHSARVFGGQMVRNMATVGGNICCGSPAADLVPPLLVLDADATLQSEVGSRTVPLAEFFVDYKQNVRRPDELLTQISWPMPPTDSVNRFYKLARRKGDAITVVGIAVSLTVESGICRSAHIALGAVAPIVKRAAGAERMLEGELLTSELIEEAARQAVAEASPIDDVRASAAYRRHSVRVLTRRLLMQAWEQLP